MYAFDDKLSSVQRSAVHKAADALAAALRSRGFEVDDFQLEETTSSDLANLLGVVGGILRVRCCSTGEERIYSSGSGSGWLGAFLMDLGKGCFANATRHRGSGYLPLSQPVAPQLYA